MKTKGIAMFQYHREDDTPSPTYENKLGFFNGARVWLVRRLRFSLSDIKYIHQWYLFYTATPQIGQQAVGQLTQIPWGRNLKIVSKCRSIDEALY
jgi:DNA-binding GntR family transcriptional regulator